MFVSHLLSKYLTKGKLQSSAIAITLGLVVAYFAGVYTQGTKGISDIAIFSGFALLGGAMIRDLAIASTAFEVDVKEVKKAGKIGFVALLLGCVVPFIIGAMIARVMGYKDPVSMTTIGAGAMTYIVGPITGTAIGASSEVIALSIAIGLIKSVFFMVGTPLLAKFMYLKSPRSAMVLAALQVLPAVLQQALLEQMFVWCLMVRWLQLLYRTGMSAWTFCIFPDNKCSFG